MEARKKLKQTYKTLVNAALDQARSEVKVAHEQLPVYFQLVTDSDTYQQLAKKAEARKKKPTPSLLSMCTMQKGSSGSDPIIAKLCATEDQKTRAATVFFRLKACLIFGYTMKT
jgi:hypothetical protein